MSKLLVNNEGLETTEDEDGFGIGELNIKRGSGFSDGWVLVQLQFVKMKIVVVICIKKVQ